MTRNKRTWRSRQNRRRLFAEALEPRLLLAVDTWVLELDANGNIDLFGPNAAGDLGNEYEQNPFSDGNTIGTSNVPGQNNQAPIAVDDAVTTNEDTLLNGDVLAANPTTPDSDPDSDPITVTRVNGLAGNVGAVTALTSGATVNVAAGGTFAYDPNGAFESLATGATTTDTFTYTIADSFGALDTATVTVTVTGVNDAPTATNLNQTKGYLEDAPSVALDDIVVSDLDNGDTITAKLTLANTATGSLTATSGNGETYTPGTGVWTVTGSAAMVNAALAATSFVPAANNVVSTTITTHIEDQAPSGPANGVITLTATAVNDEPSFTKGPDQMVLEDAGAQTVNGWVVAHSTGPADEAGQTRSFNITGNTNAGLFSAAPAVSSSGVLTYTPAANANGSAVITLNIMDNGGTANGGDDTSPPQSFTITVTPVNDEPSFTKGPDQMVLEDAGAQTVNGWVVAHSTGPANEAAQTKSFNITGNTNAGLFSAAPAVSSSGVLTYTPAANANGSAVITLNIMDNGGTANGGDDTSPPQSFTITVTPVNDAPSFTKGLNQTVLEDAGAQSVPTWATGLSKGPADEAGQTLSFNITGNTNLALFSSLPAVSPSGTLSYTPAANANGSAVITLNIMDNGGTANMGVDTSADQTFTINVTAVNDVPSFTAANDTSLEDEGAQSVVGWATGLSAGPANESGQTLSFNITSNSNMALFATQPAVSSTGTLTYTSAANANGSAVITLNVKDNGGTANGGVDTSADQTFTINVTAVNDVPSFTKGADETVSEDATAQTVSNWATSLSKGPADEAGQTLSFNITSNSNTALFSAGPAVDSSGQLTYTPAANANGSAVITLNIMDNGGTANMGVDTSADQTFTINVTAVNDVPSFTAANDTSLEDEGAQSVVGWATGLSAGPANESGQTLSFNITSNSNMALFATQPAVSSTGTLTYTSAANANGSAVITLNVMDNGGTANGGVDTSADQTFTINVTAVNDVPSFTKGADETVSEDATAQTVSNWATSLSKGPADEAGQTLSFNITSNSNTALFSAGPAVDSSGQLTYTPAANANGSAVITLNIMDNGGTANMGVDTSADQTFTINVTAVNDVPSFTAANDTSLEDEGAQSVVGWATGLSAGPANESGQTLSFNITSNSNMALFATQPAVSSTGTLTYTSAANANGSAVITLNVMDNGGTANGGVDTSADQTFTINVTPVNDVPSFTKGADETVSEDATAQTVSNWATSLSKGPADEAGQTLSFNITSNSNMALFSAQPAVDSSGQLTYTPAANANGSAVITLNIMDNGGTANMGVDTSADQTFTINVTAVNDVPSFTAANDTSLEDEGAQSVVGWATGLSAGPANESGQTLSFNITSNSNMALFATQPAVSSTGTLTYTSAANANGSAVITLNVMDNGGTANGGVDTSADQTFTINVTAVNDVPSFTKGADETVSEDATAQTVSNWATSLSKGPADEAGQTLSFNITSNSNTALFSAGPAVDSSGQLTYTPAANANGSAVITLNIMDNGGTANMGVDTSADQTFTINVTAVNDVPSFTAANDTSLEDEGAQSVVGWATGLSAGPANESGQTLSFNITSNSNMALFATQPAVSSTGTLTYTSAANANGSAVITLNVMDNGGTANGGVDTSADQTFTINVTAVNDVPSFTKGGDPTVLEDAAAQTVPNWATSLSKGPADEAGQTLSFNITSNSNTALFSAGPAVDSSGQLTYTPAANANGSAVITLNIMDNGGTANMGVDTSADQTFTINVTAVNDPPAFSNLDGTLLADGSTASTGGNRNVTESEVQWLTGEAVRRWEASGISDAQREALLDISYQIGDLPAGRLGSYNDGVITVDADAAGRGWFVDPTPDADEEYTLESGQLLASDGSAAARHMDLLTFLLHEQGHALGLDHVPATSGSANVMISSLRTGLRRLPEDGQAHGASPGSITGAQFMGTTLVVPTGYATIAAAVAAAVAGDTIQINSGTYNESVDLSASAGSLTFIGNDTGGGLPIVEATAAHNAPAFFNSTAKTADFTFDSLVLRSDGTTGNENGIRLDSVTGTVRILDSTFNNTDDAKIVIIGNAGSSTIVLISGNTGADGTQAGDFIELETNGTSKIEATIVSNNAAIINNSVDLDSNDSSVLTVFIKNNNFTGTAGTAPINIISADSSSLNLTVVDNILSCATGDGIKLDARNTASSPPLNLSIADNTFTSVGSAGDDSAIELIANGTSAVPTINARITGNTFGTTGSIAGAGVKMEGNTRTGTTFNVVADGNTFAKTNSAGGSGAFVVQAEGVAFNLDLRNNTVGSAIGATPGFYLDQITGGAGTITIEDAPPSDNTTSNGKGEIEDNNTYSGTGSEVVIVGAVNFTVGAGGLGDAVDDSVVPVLLGNFVWDDNGAGGGTAGDGIQNGTEPGVANVEVVLTGTATGTVFTDSKGEYYFSVLPGSYTVTVTPPTGKSFSPKDAPNSMNTMDTIDSDFDPGTGQASVNIMAGIDDLTIDAGLVNAPPPFEQLDMDVEIFDPELNAIDDYTQATLQLRCDGGANAGDEFSNTGMLGPLTPTGDILVGGIDIGTVTTNGSGTLLLSFSGPATQTRVNQALQGITYRNSTASPCVQLNYTFNDGNTGSQGPGLALVGTGFISNPLRVASGENVADGPKTPLTASDLDGVVGEAIARWATVTDSAATVTLLQNVRFEVADLPNDILGSTLSNVISLDLDAAGFGWFIDTTPSDNVEFDTLVAETELSASAGSEAFGAIDLLTVVMHELGHVLGRSHNLDAPHDVMAEDLTTGTRRLPVVSDQKSGVRSQESGASAQPEADGTFDVNGDGEISPLDAQLIIDALENNSPLSPQSAAALDTNGDGIVSPIDALLVFNYWSQHQTNQGEAEAPASFLQPNRAAVGEPLQTVANLNHLPHLASRVAAPLPAAALELEILPVADDLLDLLAADIAQI